MPSAVPARPGEADGHKIWDKSYRSLCVHVSEKEGDAAEGGETGALPGGVSCESGLQDK